MAADAKIAALYGLPIESSPKLCDEISCTFFVEYLSKFHDFVRKEPTSHPWITKSELDSMGLAINILLSKEPSKSIKWYPEYGCALLLAKGVGCTPGVVAWNLISLDLHRFDTMSKLNSNTYEYVDTANATDYEVLHIGTSTQDQTNELMSAFNRFYVEAQAVTGNDRSSRGGDRLGHQRTPAFIHALFRKAFGAQNVAPRGGFTDVGLHTGGEKRDTAWPLVFSILRQLLYTTSSNGSPEYFSSKISAYFGLYVAKVTLDQYLGDKGSFREVSNAPHKLLDFAYRILQSAARKASMLADDGIDMVHFRVWSKELRDSILFESSDQSSKFSKQFVIPDTYDAVKGKIEDFKIQLPKESRLSKDDVLSETMIHGLEVKNLGAIGIPNLLSLEGVATWATSNSSKAKSQLESIHFMRTVENLVWDYAEDFSKTLAIDQLEQLASLVDQYRSVLHHFIRNKECSGLSIVGLRSREVLMVWIDYCVIHASTVQMHRDEMSINGVALNFGDLRHLVLSRPEEWEIVRNVSKYLNASGNSRPVFSLCDEHSTFEMGARVALASPEMQEIWRQEQHDAKCRVEGHWNEVLKKKERAATLRSEISTLHTEISHTSSQLARKQNELAAHEAAWSWKNRHRRLYNKMAKEESHLSCENEVNKLSRELNHLNSKLRSKQSDLERTIQAPPPVLQPLPQQKNTAMAIIFFLYMPREFQLLSKFSFTAKQVLLPDNWSSCWGGKLGDEKVNISGVVTRASHCQFSWTDYYNSHQQSIYHTPHNRRRGKDFFLSLRSIEKVVPKTVGSQCIDYMYGKDDGIWCPDALSPRMAWFGGNLSFDVHSGQEINPFASVDHYCIVSHFTERLGSKSSDLQWALIQTGDDYINLSRGNLPYSSQHSKPAWLTRNQYISLGSMMSYPNIQLRNILKAFMNNELPFEKRPIQTLINQALFQIGQISVKQHKTKLEWKCDLYDADFGRSAYCILQSFCEEIADSPKRYKVVRVLGNLCNFLSHWETHCRTTARSLAESVCRWADSIEENIEKVAPSEIPPERASQVVYYQQSSLVLLNGELNQSDVTLLIRMVVRARNLFTDGNKENEIYYNDIEIKYCFSQSIDTILTILVENPQILTDALSSVFQRCPPKLIWKPWRRNTAERTSCFTAKCREGNIYAMNVITGDVLINGMPPSRLPLEILRHPLYRRTFGSRNHEVVNIGNALETARPASDRFYRFSLHGSVLEVIEFRKDGSEKLELMDSTVEGIECWGRELPMRLKVMHSHWLLREERVIVVRGVRFDVRDISFLIRLDGKCNRGTVECIEQHSEDRKKLQIVLQKQDRDILVSQESLALDVLAKFESKLHIYSLVSHATSVNPSEIKFHFPRYKLTFHFDPVRCALFCHEISGYKLAKQQQIEITLRGTTTYLVLEKEGSREPQRLLISPKGIVVREPNGNVSIQSIEDCDAEQTFFKFNFHHRFDYLETKQSCSARMQLAALHAATSHALPDEMFQMTGEERAIELIRQTWRNCPLNKDENLALENIKNLARGKCPSLFLLCEDISIGASQFHFLHLKSSTRVPEYTNCFEGTSYYNNVKSRKVNCRSFLSKHEEIRLLGEHSRQIVIPPRVAPNQSLEKPPVMKLHVDSIIASIGSVRSKIESSCEKVKLSANPFPLDIKTASTLEHDMVDELKNSWEAHSAIHNEKLRFNSDAKYLSAFQDILVDVTRLRRQIEDYSLSALNDMGDEEMNCHQNAHCILQMLGLIPTATKSDLAKIAIDPNIIASFNPMLNLESLTVLQSSILTWLRLCVYEDKLMRLISLSDSASTDELLRELHTETVWDTDKNPAWLVFEVENMLQIRQVQYKVAQHLIDHPGDVMQLNMGTGKLLITTSTL
ncbi:hypothetical protein ACHAXS_014340 [Conticribra weissflogii]